MRFDLVDLRLFVNIIDAGSITAGARASHLSAGSASARLTEMEESLGQRLLVRSKGGVHPTPPGIALLEHARTIVFQVEQLQSDMSAFSDGREVQIKVLCNTSSASEFLPPLLSRFLLQHPNVSIDLEERPSMDIVRLVSAGSWHVGIISNAVPSPSLQTVPFRPDPLVAITRRGHPLSARMEDGKTNFVNCLEYDFVGLSGDSALQQHIASHAARAARHLKFKVRLRSLEGVCQMVANGVGISIVPRRAAERYMDGAPVEIIPLMDEWADRMLLLCFRNSEDLPVSAKKLVEYLAAQP